MGCNKYNEKTLGVSEIMKNINLKYVELLQKTYEKYQHIDTVVTGNLVSVNGDEESKMIMNRNQSSETSSKLYTTMPMSKSLKEDSQKPVKKKMENSKSKRKSPKSRDINTFTPKEDEVLLEAIKSEKEINFTKLRKMLGRTRASVRDRVATLIIKSKSSRTIKVFSLEEDLILIEHAVSKMGDGVLLRDVNRSYLDFQDLSQAFVREIRSVYHHWVRILMVWLLSYYNKSLNLDIRPMLANYVAEHFTDVDNIQWDTVVACQEFAGHTETSISNLYHSRLVHDAQNHLGVHRKHLTLRQIAENAEKIYKNTSVSEKVKRRQMEVINHFEKLVSERKIKNFI